MNVNLRVATVLLSLILTEVATHAEDWGTLKGRLVFSGDVPRPEKLDITRDEEVCGKHNLVDESLLVHDQNHGLKNVVVWLSSKKDVPVYPSFSDESKPAELDNKDCRFVPRIVRLRTGQTLLSVNSDPVAHNVAVYARRNSPFSIVIPDDMPLRRTFAREELLPIRVDCSIHAWMRAYLVITEHPYSAISDENGEFTLPKLPYGQWEFRFWHERPGYLTKLSTAAGEVELKRGIWELEIQSPEQNLGELSIGSSEFAQDD